MAQNVQLSITKRPKIVSYVLKLSITTTIQVNARSVLQVQHSISTHIHAQPQPQLVHSSQTFKPAPMTSKSTEA